MIIIIISTSSDQYKNLTTYNTRGIHPKRRRRINIIIQITESPPWPTRRVRKVVPLPNKTKARPNDSSSVCTGDNRKLRTIVCNHSKEKERYRNPPRDKDLPCLSDHWLSFSSSSSNNNNNLIGPSTTNHCAIIYVPCNTWPRNFVPFNSINTEKKIMDTFDSLFYLNTCSVSLLSTCVDRILPCPVCLSLWLCHQLHGSVVVVANPWTLWLNSVRVAMSTMSRRLLLSEKQMR